MSTTTEPWDGVQSALLRASIRRTSTLSVGTTTWLSENQIFVETPDEATVGETVEVRLSFPGLLPESSLTCIVDEVFYAQGPGNHAGLRLRALGESERRELQRVLARFRANSNRQGSPYRILVVEDSELTLAVFRHHLERLSVEHARRIEIQEARGTQDAMVILMRRPIDLVIVDYNLNTRHSGDVLVEMIRQRLGDAGPALIGISSEGEMSRHAMLAAGADFFVAKPLVLSRLFTTLCSLASQRSNT